MPIEDGGGEIMLYNPYNLRVSPPKVEEYNVNLVDELVDAKKNCSRTPSLSEVEDANVLEAKRPFI